MATRRRGAGREPSRTGPQYGNARFTRRRMPRELRVHGVRSTLDARTGHRSDRLRGRRLARALLERRGRRRAPRSRPPARAEHLARRGCELHEGDVLDAASLARRGRRRRRRLLPRPRHGPRLEGRLRRARARRPRATSPAMAARRGRRARRLPGRPRREPALQAPAQPPRDRPRSWPARARRSPTSARRWWSARAASRTRRCATWSQRLPVMIAPALAEHADAADRRRRRRRLPGAGARAGRSRGPRGADRRARRALLRRDARPDGGRARPPPAAQAPGAGADAVALVAVDRAGHAGGRRRGAGRWWRACPPRPW